MHKQFDELASALKELHRSLLMLEAKKMEAALGRKVSPYELLGASMNDPNFAWLRVMSELIVGIDILVDESPALTAQEANKTVAQTLNILEKPPGLIATDFWTHYTEYLSTNPDIIMLHAKVKKILDSLRPQM